MNVIVPFTFEASEIRVIPRDGEPWFVLADVCRVLEIGLTGDAARRLDDDEKGMDIIHTPGGPQEMTVINESGLYSLILTSRKPAAKRFKKWVTAEVLPTIRKTGGYGVQRDPIEVLNDPAAMRGLLLTYSEKVINLEAKVEEMRPDVLAFERIAKADGFLNITEAAKALGVPRNRLFKWLHANGWIYRRAGAKNWLGYDTRVRAGLLDHKATPIARPDGTDKICEQVVVTPKGLTKLAKEIGKPPPDLALAL